MSRQVGVLGRRGRGIRTPHVPLAVCVGTCFSPRRAGAPPPVLAALAGSPVEDDDSGEDEDDDPLPEESQPLLSPPTGIILHNTTLSSSFLLGGDHGGRQERPGRAGRLVHPLLASDGASPPEEDIIFLCPLYLHNRPCWDTGA